jgi:hypothetical protein
MEDDVGLGVACAIDVWFSSYLDYLIVKSRDMMPSNDIITIIDLLFRQPGSFLFFHYHLSCRDNLLIELTAILLSWRLRRHAAVLEVHWFDLALFEICCYDTGTISMRLYHWYYSAGTMVL